MQIDNRFPTLNPAVLALNLPATVIGPDDDVTDEITEVAKPIDGEYDR